MKVKEYISYQTVDSEKDIWCQTALLFNSKEDVINFFNKPEKVLKALDHHLEDEETVTSIDYEQHFVNERSEMPNVITYNCLYAGAVKIVMMSKGFVISNE